MTDHFNDLLGCTCRGGDEPYCPRHSSLPGESEARCLVTDRAEADREAIALWRRHVGSLELGAGERGRQELRDALEGTDIDDFLLVGSEVGRPALKLRLDDLRAARAVLAGEGDATHG